MSDLTTKNRYSFDSISTGRITMQNITLPKSQPVRLKELMQMCDDDDDDDDYYDNDSNNGDDDDDDDNNDDDKNEKKSCIFEDESDIDNPQLLSQDNTVKNILQESSAYKSNNSPIESVDGFPTNMCTLQQEGNCESVSDVSCIQKRVTCINDKVEYKVNDVNLENQLPVSNLNKQETYSCKYEDNMQDSNISVQHASNNHQVDVTHDCSMDITLSSSILTDDYNVKSDTKKNVPSISNAQVYHENACASDILKRKEKYLMQEYNASMESKMPVSKSSDTYSSHSSNEEQQHKGVHSFTEQANTEESQTLKIPNATPQSLSSMPQSYGNLMHSTKRNSQISSIAKYEANEKFTPAKSSCAEFSTPSLSETGKSLTTINRLILDTPLKHLPAHSMHPNSSASHKQLFCTPQNKLPDNPNKNHVQTPCTTLSNWCHSNVKCTQMEGKSLFAKEHVQTPRNTICTPVVERSELPKFFGIDAKNVRRPLADARFLHSDNPMSYSADPKALLLHTRPEAKSIATSEAQQENKNWKIVSDGTLIQTETSYDNDLRLTKPPIEDVKENKQCNALDAGSDKRTMQSQNESKQVIIGSSTGARVVQDSSRKYNEQNSARMHEHYSVREKQQEQVRQIADKMTNIQFSVPTSVLPQRQNGKTLFVKDREYLILGSLGRGMSGEVLRVQDLSCGEMRAIKCVDLSKMDKESAQGCLDEISMLRKLQAPCVIKMFDYHIREFMVYVIMEMGDTDLSRLLKSMSQEKQIPFTMILYYWTEMLTAVKHIHDNGVIHSDLKPGNFLLVRGRLKLIDFGIASSINSDMTSVLKNNPIGTLNYISPEALMDIGGSADSPTHNVKYKISFKSDVWSLGCILYSMVYGYTPFHHIRPQWAKVNAITNPKPNISFPMTTFSTTGGDSKDHERAPPILIDVMRKCLQHDPKSRPTVSQLLQVQYVPVTQHATLISVPDVPPHLLVKIKNALSDDEWRQFVQVLDTKRNHT